MNISAADVAAVIQGERAPDNRLLEAFSTADSQTIGNIVAELRSMPQPTHWSTDLATHALFKLPDGVPANYASTQTHWWGWELYLPEAVMNQVKGVGMTAGGISSILSAAAAAGFIAPAAAPFLATAAAAIAIRWGVMVAVDKGDGIKLESPWPWPVALVPVPIDA